MNRNITNTQPFRPTLSAKHSLSTLPAMAALAAVLSVLSAACMKAERLGTDTNSPNGFAFGLEISLPGGGGSAAPHRISGSISGLTGSGLVLANGADSTTVPAGSVSFAFDVAVPSGSAYSIAVTGRPAGQSCSIANGKGIMGSADVSNVQVVCHASGSVEAPVLLSTATSDWVKSIAFQSDGRAIVAGEYPVAGTATHQCIARLNASGAPDSSFGTSGRTCIPLSSYPTSTCTPGSTISAGSVALDPQTDQIVLAGGSGSCFTLARYDRDGKSADTTFGTGGLVATKPGVAANSGTVANALLLESDRSMFIGGFSTASNSTSYAFTGRISKNGSLIPFSTSYDYYTDAPSGSNAYGYSLARQSADRLIMGGGWTSLKLYAFDAAGNMSPGFGTAGIATDAGLSSGVRSMAVQSDGRIVSLSNSYNCSIARYNADGTPDTSFAGAGAHSFTLTSDLGALYYCGTVAIQTDGKIVVVGTISYSSGIFVVRLNANGSRDTTFAPSGVLKIGTANTSGGQYACPASYTQASNAGLAALDGNGAIYAAYGCYDSTITPTRFQTTLVRIWE